MGDANDETSQWPDFARIVVAAQQDKVDDKGLEDENFVAVEKVGSCKSLLDAEAEPGEKRASLLSKHITTFCGGDAGHSTIVDDEQPSLESFADLFDIGSGIHDGEFKGRDMQDFD